MRQRSAQQTSAVPSRQDPRALGDQGFEAVFTVQGVAAFPNLRLMLVRNSVAIVTLVLAPVRFEFHSSHDLSAD